MSEPPAIVSPRHLGAGPEPPALCLNHPPVSDHLGLTATLTLVE